MKNIASIICNVLLAILVTGFLMACEGETFNDKMRKVTSTLDKIDSVTVKISKGASKIYKVTESYVDTTVYKKDSTGMWKKKH